MIAILIFIDEIIGYSINRPSFRNDPTNTDADIFGSFGLYFGLYFHLEMTSKLLKNLTSEKITVGIVNLQILKLTFCT